MALPLFLCHAFRLAAQDPFEIHIYEYEPMRLGQYSLEAHLNMNAQGTTGRDGPLLPTEHQVHLTLEPTVGLSETSPSASCSSTPGQPGYSPRFAGWRILPHKDPLRGELAPPRVAPHPFDREFAHWQLVLNPVFERALHGPGTARGRNFEPAVLVRRCPN